MWQFYVNLVCRFQWVFTYRILQTGTHPLWSAILIWQHHGEWVRSLSVVRWLPTIILPHNYQTKLFGSKSKTVYKFYGKYFQEDSALSYTYQSRSWYKLVEIIVVYVTQNRLCHLFLLHNFIPKPIKVNVDALIDWWPVISALPPKYDPNNPESVRVYRNAIESLGTHFIYSAKFGGTQRSNCICPYLDIVSDKLVP